MLTVALRGVGLDDLVAELDRHRQWLADSGGLEQRRIRRARDEVVAIAMARLRERWENLGGSGDLDALAARITAGELDPYAAAHALLAAGKHAEDMV